MLPKLPPPFKGETGDHGKVMAGKVLFVDDTQKHCTAVSTTCTGVDTLTVAGVEGLVESELESILGWALEGGSV